MSAIARLGAIAAAAALVPLGASAATAGAHAPAVAASHRTQVIGKCTKPLYKPAKLVFTCGDGSIGMVHIRYTTWTKAAATGTGTYVYNTCQPTCASGTIKRKPGTKLLLHKVVQTQKYGPLFVRATVTYPNGKRQTYHMPRRG